MHLGVAFQLIDDVLDYSASPEDTGKNLGDDLAEGKPTLPLAEGKPTLPLLHAMSRGTPVQAKLIRKAIENGGHGNMSAVFAAIESTGGITYTAQAAQQEANQAITAIESLPASPYKEALYSLAEFSVNRAY
jgi:octaprenyl-diphosphate synthase